MKKSDNNAYRSDWKYHYREVICPLCDHIFMDETHKQTCNVEGDERKFYLTYCPACGEKLLVPEGELEGLIMADIPKDILKLHPYLT